MKSILGSYTQKTTIIGHVCTITDSQKIKLLILVFMDVNNKAGRQYREQMHGIIDYYGASYKSYSAAAHNKKKLTR